MAKQKRDSEATKAKIIENAMHLFSEDGFDATTVDKVAQKSGVNKALLYYYYKNKVGLYEAVMSEILTSIHHKILESEKCCKSPLGELKTFIETYARYTQKHPYFPALLLRELSDGGRNLPDIMFTNMRCLFKLLSDTLKDGEKEGIFHNVTPMIIYFMIIGTLNLLITTKSLRAKAEEIDEIDTCSNCSIDEISDYIFQKTKLMLEVTDEENISCT